MPLRQKVQNLSEILCLILLTWKYTGLPIYKIDRKSQKIVILYTKTYIFGIFILLFLLYFYTKTAYDIDIGYDIIIFVQFAALILNNIFIVLLSYKKRKQFAQIFTKLLVSEKRIRKLIKKESKNYNNIRNDVFKKICLEYFSFFVSFILDNIIGIETDVAVNLIQFIFYIHFEIVLYFYLSTLKYQYQEIIIYVNSSDRRFDKIQKIFSIRLILLQNFTLGKNTFEITILIKLLRNVITTSIGIYLISEDYVYNQVPAISLETLANISWMLFFITTNFLLPVAFQEISDQVIVLNYKMFYLNVILGQAYES